MKKVLPLFLLIFLFSSCTHRIVRNGYSHTNSNNLNCPVVIKKHMEIPGTLKKVGEIKLGESGFSVSCSESAALQILRKEACSLNASIINIIEENRPDLLSSCYRCRAEFYTNTDMGKTYQSDEQYSNPDVSTRVTQDRTRNTFIGIGAFVVGFLSVFLLLQ